MICWLQIVCLVFYLPLLTAFFNEPTQWLDLRLYAAHSAAKLPDDMLLHAVTIFAFLLAPPTAQQGSQVTPFSGAGSIFLFSQTTSSWQELSHSHPGFVAKPAATPQHYAMSCNMPHLLLCRELNLPPTVNCCKVLMQCSATLPYA